MTAIVTRGDAGNLPLPDASVDLIVTSPPYFGLRSYTDGGVHYAEQIGAEATPAEYLDALLACTAEWLRVLKPSGSLFVNLGDKYTTGNSGQSRLAEWSAENARGGALTQEAAKQRSGRVAGRPPKSLQGLPWRYALRCMDELGLILRAEIVWAKPNGMPESVTDRVRRSHEQVFHFVLQPRYFAAVDAVRESYLAPTATRSNPGKNFNRGDKGGNPLNAVDSMNPLGKLPGSVWSIPTSPLRVPEWLGVDHFAAYPPELVRRIVLGWSPEGGTVLDPFGGTGTTALVASVHGRVGISLDLSADYCRLAQWRTTDPKQRAKAAQAPKPARKPSGTPHQPTPRTPRYTQPATAGQLHLIDTDGDAA